MVAEDNVLSRETFQHKSVVRALHDATLTLSEVAVFALDAKGLHKFVLRIGCQ
jgi:hypothetical protein